MKTNKLAAGALALALGLGAVAPTVAQAKDYTASQLFLMDHKEVLAEANELFPKYNEAREKRAAAKKAEKAAEKELKAAREAFEKAFPHVASVMVGTEKKEYGEVQATALKEAVAKLDGNTITDVDKAKAAYTAIKADATLKTDEARYDALVKKFKDDSKKAPFEAQVQAERLAKEVIRMDKIGAVTGAKEYRRYLAAQYNYDQAVAHRKDVEEETADVISDYLKAEAKLKETAERFNVTVQVGNDGFKLVNKDDKKVEAAEKKSDKLARLKAVKENAEESLRAAKLLLELAPATVKPVEAKLNDLVKKQEALIEKANKELKAEKVAFIATAYADDASADEVDSLIKELEDNTKEIQDTIKGNEEKVVEENKKEEKKEDKKEEAKEDKKEDKKEEKTPAKKAGNNVKTGIAGVAGVAGILAAAATAYAATKRD